MFEIFDSHHFCCYLMNDLFSGKSPPIKQNKIPKSPQKCETGWKMETKVLNEAMKHLSYW